MKKTYGCGIGICCSTMYCFFMYIIIPEIKYNKASKFLSDGEYEQAFSLLDQIDRYKDSEELANKTRYTLAEKALECGQNHQAALLFGAASGYLDAYQRSVELWSNFGIQNTVCSDGKNVFAIREDGSVSVLM